MIRVEDAQTSLVVRVQNSIYAEVRILSDGLSINVSYFNGSTWRRLDQILRD